MTRVFSKIASSCAGSHSFCEPIYSEDTNLFRIMNKPATMISSFPSLLIVLPIPRNMKNHVTSRSGSPWLLGLVASVGPSSLIPGPFLQPPAAIYTNLHKKYFPKFCSLTKQKTRQNENKALSLPRSPGACRAQASRRNQKAEAPHALPSLRSCGKLIF